LIVQFFTLVLLKRAISFGPGTTLPLQFCGVFQLTSAPRPVQTRKAMTGLMWKRPFLGGGAADDIQLSLVELLGRAGGKRMFHEGLGL
jgi:hypothetical protein